MSQWPTIALHYLVRFGNGQDYSDVELADGPYPVIGSGGPFASTDQYLFDGESVLFGRKGTIDKPRYETGRFWTVDTMFYSVPGPRVVPRWLYYWALTVPFGLYSTSTALPSMTSAVLGRLRVSLPPLPEQHAIADYLDRETAKIDTLIEKQTTMIERLQERLTAVISHALDQSTLERRVSLRYLSMTPITAGVNASGDSGNPPEWPRFVRTTDIASMVTLHEDRRVTIDPGLAATATVKKGDILATRAGTVGKSYIHTSDEKAAYAGYLVRIRLKNAVDAKYVAYWMRSEDFWQQISAGAIKATIENFSASKYRALRAPVPALLEQREIVGYLDRETAKIDTLIAKVERHIELAKERRATLITAAVTGQIDVTKDAA
jgi:type I restriction enzyme S subunit